MTRLQRTRGRGGAQEGPTGYPGQDGEPGWPPQAEDPQSLHGGFGLTRSAWTDPAAPGWEDPDARLKSALHGYPDDVAGHGPGPRRLVIRGRRWPLAALAVVLAVAAAAAAVSFIRAGSPRTHPAAGAGPAPAAVRPSAVRPAAGPAAQPLTVSAARRVLAGWLTGSDKANRLRSSSALARIESGASFQMDAGSYLRSRVADPAGLRYRPLTLAHLSFFIPAGSDYPMWFAVRCDWTRLHGSRAGLDAAVLVFTRASAVAPWLEVLEPNLLPASSRIHIARTRSGQAEQLTPAAAADMSVPPSSIQRLTAQYLDSAGAGRAGLSVPGTLRDLSDEQYWRAGHLPPGSAVSVTHAASGNPVFALRTAGGGAVLFFDLTATMTVTAPPGGSIRITVPGYYSARQPVTTAALGYVDQFAAYDPPQGSPAGPVVIASVSGIAA
jgi:hypothetical protein